jgi:dTDP-glucose pyrophosphorylase
LFQRLKDCLVDESATIREAMTAINRGAVEIALVTNREGVVIGTCTDGDIRRALLSGLGLESPVASQIQRNFVWVSAETGRAEVLDLMYALQIHQIPVLDSERRAVGLHLIRELIGAVERPNWAVLMAGGKGTRLRPLTDSLPKPMIPVAGRPILERLVLHLVGYGIRRIFLSVNYLSSVVEEFFGDGRKYGCEIEYLREDRPLGTVGGLSLLPQPAEHPVVVMNGDLVTGVNVADMLAFHVGGRYLATVGVREYLHTVPFGTVETDGGRIRLISEKPTYSWLINAGTYVVNPEFVARVPKGSEYPITSLLEEALTRQEPVGAYRMREDWIDVGRISDLAHALGSPARGHGGQSNEEPGGRLGRLGNGGTLSDVSQAKPAGTLKVAKRT